MGKVLVVKIVKGKEESREVVEGVRSEEVVKQVARKILPEWDPRKSDLIIMRHASKELVPTLKRSFSIYIISYKGLWEREGIKESEIHVVMPYVGKETEEVLNILKDYTLS